MDPKYLFFGFFLVVLFFFHVGFVSSQECSIAGEIIDGEYCDPYGDLKSLKDVGNTCLNNYECLNGNCIEEVCQYGRFTSIGGSTSAAGDIWEFFSGEQCDPLFDTDYFCEGTIAFLCGENYVWEYKGEIQGVCGVPFTSDPPGSGGGSPSPKVVILSPKDVIYGSSSIPLEVFDSKRRAKYWKYSLNDGARIDFTPNTTISAPDGVNSLIVYASEYRSFSRQGLASVEFNVVLSSSPGNICGDNVCGNLERCNTCESDCGACYVNVGSYCGDNICDVDESSASCSEDCIPLKRKDRLWLFYLLFFLFLSFLFVAGFFVFRKIKTTKYDPKQIFNTKSNPLNLNAKRTFRTPSGRKIGK